MSKAISDVVLDQALNKIATATRQSVCSGQPANFAGIAAVQLAPKTLSGAFTVGAGSQRRVTVAAQNGTSITASGTANHIAYDDGTTLLAVTTCTSQALTSDGTVTVPSHMFQLASPT